MKLSEQPGKLHYYALCLLEYFAVFDWKLLVALLQRYRYIQAYQVDLRLQKIEEAFVSENQVGEEVLSRMQSQSHWRKELVVSTPDTFSYWFLPLFLV